MYDKAILTDVYTGSFRDVRPYSLHQLMWKRVDHRVLTQPVKSVPIDKFYLIFTANSKSCPYVGSETKPI